VSKILTSSSVQIQNPGHLGDIYFACMCACICVCVCIVCVYIYTQIYFVCLWCFLWCMYDNVYWCGGVAVEA
jgi:hypothetical protein